MKINTAALKKLALYLFYIALSVAILAAVLGMNDLEAIGEALSQINPVWLFAALGCVLGYLILYPISLCIISHAQNCKINAPTTYSIGMTEHFFNSITPMSTGGQPFQVYCFGRARVKAAESTCVLLMNFIVFMMVTNGFALCSLFFCHRFIFPPDAAPNWAILGIGIFGFTCNFSVLVITFLVATNKRVCSLICKLLDLICTLARPLDRLLQKILRKDQYIFPEKAESLKVYFAQVQEAFGLLMKRKKHFLLALIARALSMGSLYLATYFILWALGLEIPAADIFFIVCGTSFVITMVVFIPTPGASGGIEPAFAAVFSSIIANFAQDPEKIPHAAMLIWRLLTYYFVMGVSFLFYIGLEIYFAIKAKRSPAPVGEEGEDIAPAILAANKPKKKKAPTACEDCGVYSCKNDNGTTVTTTTEEEQARDE